MTKKYKDSFQTKTELSAGGKAYQYHSLKTFAQSTGASLQRLPFSIRILLENLLRYEDGITVQKQDIEAIQNYNPTTKPTKEIQFRPARILLQDFTGVPAVADLAAMRGAIQKLGGQASQINPLQPADLVIDHSVQVDFFGNKEAEGKNEEIEFQRNQERYEFLKWGQTAFQNFRVVPPATGIVHQVNLEYLAQVAMTGNRSDGDWVYPDTLVGTDSHTTMINGLGVLGWGVGGIEAEAAMLGQPISMLIPQVVGFKLTGKMPAGTTATDLVLIVVQMLRAKGVVGKFVEFFGPGLSALTLADRATLANMAPEYGATCGIFPVDEQTIGYLKLTGREEHVERCEKYYKAQDLWYSPETEDPTFSDVLEFDLGSVEPSLAGPTRPQDRIALKDLASSFKDTLPSLLPKEADPKNLDKKTTATAPDGESFEIEHGSVVIAAITSCTNTSNPSVLIAAGLLAKKAVEKGLTVAPWVKTSLAPGSRVVTDYLIESGLMESLEKLNFHIVGYGCTTCIGNSGPLPSHVSKAIDEGKHCVSAVLSGNRNFEGRIHAQIRANYLASPPLVVAYALAGNAKINLTTTPLGQAKDGKDVFLKDIWPSSEEIESIIHRNVHSKLFKKNYGAVFEGNDAWKKIHAPKGELYQWSEKSTYIKEPPFFSDLKPTPDPMTDIKDARVFMLLEDSVTTDHISPAGSFAKDSPAGIYLCSLGVDPKNFNSYGSRRGNHEVMMRGTFANVRIRNQLAPGTEGGFSRYLPTNDVLPAFDVAMKYQEDGTPLIVLAGKEYGTGSSRDWAAKGTKLLGVTAVIAQSFERIHRSNLIGMGVLPLQFQAGEGYEKLGLTGEEKYDIEGIGSIKSGAMLTITAKNEAGQSKSFQALVRIDTPNELEYYKNGGILSYVLRQALKG